MSEPREQVRRTGHLPAGDQMQSALSRICEFLRDQTWQERDLPYEVHMALLEGESAVEAWTEARRAD